MKKTVFFLCLFFSIVHFSGCAAVTALRHPDKKNLAVLNAGISRENVITYLGAPVSSKLQEGKRVEIYQFKQGISGGAKAVRATLHVVMDLLTFFVWEIVAWPAELIFGGEEMTVKVQYDEENKVEDVQVLKIN